MSLLNLLILICYKRVINRTVFSEFIEFIDFDLLQKKVINRIVFCEFIEFNDFDLLQMRDK